MFNVKEIKLVTNLDANLILEKLRLEKQYNSTIMNDQHMSCLPTLVFLRPYWEFTKKLEKKGVLGESEYKMRVWLLF